MPLLRGPLLGVCLVCRLGARGDLPHPLGVPVEVPCREIGPFEAKMRFFSSLATPEAPARSTRSSRPSSSHSARTARATGGRPPLLQARQDVEALAPGRVLPVALRGEPDAHAERRDVVLLEVRPDRLGDRPAHRFPASAGPPRRQVCPAPDGSGVTAREPTRVVDVATAKRGRGTYAISSAMSRSCATAVALSEHHARLPGGRHLLPRHPPRSPAAVPRAAWQLRRGLATRPTRRRARGDDVLLRPVPAGRCLSGGG